MASQYSNLGDYTLEKFRLSNFEGRTLDLESAFVELTFNESIYEPVIYGKCVIKDSSDLSQFFPLIGEETIEFEYNVDRTEKIQKKFRVYRVETQKAEETLVQTLYFASEEMFEDQNSLISKAYNTTVDSIVRDALSFLSTDKDINFGRSSSIGRKKVVVPNWSPIETINWAASVALNSTYNSSSYVFFENKNGFNFLPIEEIVFDGPVDTFEYSIQNLPGERNKGKTFKSFNQVSGTSDTLKSLGEGMYANSYQSYDNISKKLYKSSFNYRDSFDTYNHLNQFPLNSQEFPFSSREQRSSIVPYKEFDLFRTAGPRTSYFSQMTSRQFDVDFYGDTVITSGIVLEMDFVNITKLDSKFGQNHRFDRKNFLVTNCKHIFTQQTYMIESRVASDSLPNEPEYLL